MKTKEIPLLFEPGWNADRSKEGSKSVQYALKHSIRIRWMIWIVYALLLVRH